MASNEFLSLIESLMIDLDKYAASANHCMVAFSSENTAFYNMSRSEVTFILWLYSTVLIRDTAMGRSNSEELLWWYHKALMTLRKVVRAEEQDGVYSDHLVNALASIQATAVLEHPVFSENEVADLHNRAV